MMRVPGANVLRKAFNAVARDRLQYYNAIGRTSNSAGQDVTEYAEGKTIRGSFQPIQKNKYVHLGLDLQKSYFYLYISKNYIDLQRDVSADQLGFQGQRFQMQSTADWYHIDGWLQIRCVMIGLDTGAEGVFGFNVPDVIGGNENFDNGNFLPDVDTEHTPLVG